MAKMYLRAIRGSEKPQAPASSQMHKLSDLLSQLSPSSICQSKGRTTHFMRRGSVTKWPGLRGLDFYFSHISFFFISLLLSLGQLHFSRSCFLWNHRVRTTSYLLFAHNQLRVPWATTKNRELPKLLLFLMKANRKPTRQRINREIPEFSIILVSEEGFSVFRLNTVPLRRAAKKNKSTRCEAQFFIFGLFL